MKEVKYKIGERVKIKKEYATGSIEFTISSIDFNSLVEQNTYSGTSDDGSRVLRVIESWLEL